MRSVDNTTESLQLLSKMSDSQCKHDEHYCFKSYRIPECGDHLITDQDCPSNCRHPNCPLARPSLCRHPRSKCPNLKCPSNCRNKSCPGIPNRRGKCNDEPTPPSQWTFEGFSPILLPFRVLVALLCLVAFGLPNLGLVWQKIETNWDETKRNVVDRLSNAAIVVCDLKPDNDQDAHKVFTIKAGLLLSSTGGFLTTTVPPTAKPFLDYTAFAPYTCLLLSFATSLGSLIVTSALQFVVRSCEQGWFRRVRLILHHYAYDTEYDNRLPLAVLPVFTL